MNYTLKKSFFFLGVLFTSCSIFSQKKFGWIDKNENENYTPRHECSFVQAGDKFILFGGRESARKLEVYDFKSDTWSEGGKAPQSFNHFQATTYKGLVWVIGAFRTNSFPNEIPATHIYMYNPATKKWNQGIEIPKNRRRGGAGLVVYNDKFYVVGGNTVGHNGGYTSWFDEYDPTTGKWTALEDAPHARDHFSAAILNEKLYAVGGRKSGGSGGVFAPLVAKVDVYNFKTKTWSVLNENLPTPRAAACVVNFQGEIFAAGGEGSKKGPAYKTVEAYNPEKKQWIKKADMNYARHGTQAIVSGKGIYTLCGSPNRGGGRQKNMEVYGKDKPEGTPIVASEVKVSEHKIEFDYSEDQKTPIEIDIELSISNGNAAVYLNDVTISGHGFSLAEDYQNRLLDANSTETIKVIFNPSPDVAATGLVAIEVDGKLLKGVALKGKKP